MKRIIYLLSFIFVYIGYGQVSDNLRKATEQRDAKVQNNLASCYYFGKGVEKSKSKAIYWLRKTCENFNDKACEKLNEIK